MDLTKCEVNTNNIENLSDTPAMESKELKRLFDKTGKDIKDYINEILIKEVQKELEAILERPIILVESNLNSNSKENALSASMGKKLNEEKQKNILYGKDEPTGGEDGDFYFQYFD